MNGRTVFGAATGCLLAAGAALALLEAGGPAAIEVHDPPAALLALPEGAVGVVAAPALEPRPHPHPALEVFGPRSALAAALTVVPSAPVEVVEPTAPRLADATGVVRFEVPPLEAIRLPAPEGPGAARSGVDACRGPRATFAV